MTQLTEHFELEEFTASDTADGCGIDNTPPQAVIDELTKTATLLEAVRTLLGQPVFITSGYRCEALNTEIGGVEDSQHLTGQAADFIVPDFGNARQVYDAIAAAQPPIAFDQLICEYDEWVHISQSETPRGQLIVY
jgi:zinc D-Ala-D-Ala carboxypeptidase